VLKFPLGKIEKSFFLLIKPNLVHYNMHRKIVIRFC